MIFSHYAPKTNLDATLGGLCCNGAVQDFTNWHCKPICENQHKIMIKNHDMVFGLKLTFLCGRSLNDQFNSKLNAFSEICAKSLPNFILQTHQQISMEWAIYVILGLVFFFLIAFLVVKLYKSCRHRNHDNKDTRSDSTMNLIPPIFYTEDMRDPLYQEDLRDKYKHRPSEV